MRDGTVMLWLLIAVVILVTLATWIHILRSHESTFVKVTFFVLAAIPLLGPALWLIAGMSPARDLIRGSFPDIPWGSRSKDELIRETTQSLRGKRIESELNSSPKPAAVKASRIVCILAGLTALVFGMFLLYSKRDTATIGGSVSGVLGIGVIWFTLFSSPQMVVRFLSWAFALIVIGTTIIGLLPLFGST